VVKNRCKALSGVKGAICPIAAIPDLSNRRHSRAGGNLGWPSTMFEETPDA